MNEANVHHGLGSGIFARVTVICDKIANVRIELPRSIGQKRSGRRR